MGQIRWAVIVITLTAPCLCLANSVERSSPVKNTSYVAGGERVLRHEVVIHATLHETWRAFTTAEGLRTFAVPVVEFDLKTGGRFHSNYQVASKVGDPGTIYNTVLGYLPQKMVAFKIGLTEQFPAGPRHANTLFVVVEFDRLALRKTKVTLSMLGWGTGTDWDDVYKHFDWGNAFTLKALEARFVSGPVNWQKPAVKTPDGKRE